MSRLAPRSGLTLVSLALLLCGGATGWAAESGPRPTLRLVHDTPRHTLILFLSDQRGVDRARVELRAPRLPELSPGSGLVLVPAQSLAMARDQLLSLSDPPAQQLLANVSAWLGTNRHSNPASLDPALLLSVPIVDGITYCGTELDTRREHCIITCTPAPNGKDHCAGCPCTETTDPIRPISPVGPIGGAGQIDGQ